MEGEMTTYEMTKDISNWSRLNNNHGMYPVNTEEQYSTNVSDEKAGDMSENTSNSGDDNKNMQKLKKDLLHRDIEKRRRDRINKSLAQLRDLIPCAKGKIKCEGSSRSGRLQKAKLLELAVEYLQNVSNEKDVKKEPNPDEGNSKEAGKSDPILAHSAKEIYLSGFKAGLNHILMDISSRFKFDEEEINKIIASLLSIDIKIPDILISPGPQKVEVSSQQESVSRTYASARTSSPPSALPTYIDSDFGNDFKRNNGPLHTTPQNYEQYDTVVNSLNQKNNAFSDLDDYTWSSRSPTSKCSSLSSRSSNDDQDRSIAASAAMENTLPPRYIDTHPSRANQVLLSTYVLDPVTSRYYPTMLPLEVLLNSCKNKRATESHLPSSGLSSSEDGCEQSLYSSVYRKRKLSKGVSVIQKNSEKRQHLENAGTRQYFENNSDYNQMCVNALEEQYFHSMNTEKMKNVN